MASSMRRVNTYADDPRAVSTIQRYDSLIAQNSEYLGNVTRSRILVDASDTSLQSISDILAGVRVIGLRESSALATATSMSTSVVEVDNLIDQLLDMLNTSVEGNYIFGGTKTDAPPFVRNGDAVIYQGNNERYGSRTGPNSVMDVNIPGDVFVGAQSSSLAGSVDLAPRLTNGTLLSDLNLGAGLGVRARSRSRTARATAGRSTSRARSRWSRSWPRSTPAPAARCRMGIAPDGSGFELAGTGPLTVSEVGQGGTAASPGHQRHLRRQHLTGRDVRPARATGACWRTSRPWPGACPWAASRSSGRARPPPSTSAARCAWPTCRHLRGGRAGHAAARSATPAWW